MSEAAPGGLGTSLPVAAALFVAAAFLCLLLETTGVRTGERKQIGRTHNVVVVIVVSLAAWASLPSWGHFVLALSLVLFALVSGASLLGATAALALFVSAGAAILEGTSTAVGSPAFLGFVALWTAAASGLCARAREDAAAEAATKAAVLGMVVLWLLGAGAVSDAAGAQRVGEALWITGLALVLGIAPVQGLRVDIAHGAPVAAVVFITPVGLWVFARPLADRLVAGGVLWRDAWEGAIALALFALPLVALAQTAVRRVIAVVLVSQGGLPLAAALAGEATTAASFTAALAALGLTTSLAAVPVLARPEATWEDISGYGRRHPWRAGLFVLAAAQACGLPPAAGFVVRARLAESLAPTVPWVSAGLMVGAGLAAIPVVRLALFLFAKEARQRSQPSLTSPSSTGAVVGLIVVVALGVLAGFFLPF
jgi:NADH:ubiquinone oxidoreductase subunit 2 (subunit N)